MKFLPSEMIVYNYILDIQENRCQLKLTPGLYGLKTDSLIKTADYYYAAVDIP